MRAVASICHSEKPSPLVCRVNAYGSDAEDRIVDPPRAAPRPVIADAGIPTLDERDVVGATLGWEIQLKIARID